MPSLKSRFIYYAVKRQLRNLALRGGSLEQVRAARDKASKRMFPAPAGVQVQPAHVGGCPGEWLRPDGAAANSVLLYLHGGAYITGSCHTHRGLAGHLAKAAGIDCFLLDYRLAPEHPFPAAVDDAHAAYLALHAQHPHRSIVLAGDSAGGGLTLALMQAIRAGEYAEPAALVLLSPWADLTCSGDSIERCAAIDPMLSTEWLNTSAKIYAGEESLSHPQISPLFSDFTDYPRTLIQVGTDEILLDDARRVAYAIKQAGNEVVLQEFADMWHVFQIHGSYMPESRGAIRAIANFLKGDK